MSVLGLIGTCGTASIRPQNGISRKPTPRLTNCLPERSDAKVVVLLSPFRMVLELAVRTSSNDVFCMRLGKLARRVDESLYGGGPHFWGPFHGVSYIVSVI